MSLTTFAALDAVLHRRVADADDNTISEKPVPSRKIANNTHAQRRGPDTIAVKLHDTDIVTHHRNGTIVLNAGTWYTATTRERMNEYTPVAIQVLTERGRWLLTYSIKANGLPNYDRTAPYVDGIELRSLQVEPGCYTVHSALDDADRARQDAHNKQIERMISKYLRKLNPDFYTFEACALCLPLPWSKEWPVTRLVGEEMGDTQHLIEHMIEGVYPRELIVHASKLVHPKGQRVSVPDLAKRDLRTYLRSALIVGPISIRGGHRARA